jgi:hypothetical protein
MRMAKNYPIVLENTPRLLALEFMILSGRSLAKKLRWTPTTRSVIAEIRSPNNDFQFFNTFGWIPAVKFFSAISSFWAGLSIAGLGLQT